MPRKAKPVDVSGLSEFIAPHVPKTPIKRRVVAVDSDDHKILTDMAKAASAKAGRLVSRATIVGSLIKHYQLFE